MAHLEGDGLYARIRCTVISRQPNLTIGSRRGKQPNSDIVEFKNFDVLYPNGKKVQAVALGHYVLEPVSLYLSPDGFGNIVKINKQYE